MTVDDDSPKPPAKKRRRRGSLIERAGSVYDFEAVLRARVVMPDPGTIGQSPVLDVPLSPTLSPDPISLGAGAVQAPVLEVPPAAFPLLCPSSLSRPHQR